MDCIITKPIATDERELISDNIIFAIIAMIVPNDNKREINEILNVGKRNARGNFPWLICW